MNQSTAPSSSCQALCGTWRAVLSALRGSHGSVAGCIAGALLLCLGGGRSLASTLTATSLTISANGSFVTSAAPGTPLTLTATVTSGGSAVHPGTVLFCDATAAYCLNGAMLGSAQLSASGTAALTVRLGPGLHSIRAVFVAAGTFGSSTSAAASVTVTGGAKPVNSLTFGGTQGNYTLTAILSGVSGTGKAPSGTVSFQDTSNANAVLGTAAAVASSPTGALALSAASLTTGSTGQQLAVGDLNNDGLPDVITGGAQLGIFLNNGNGTFTRKAPLTVGNATNVFAPVVGDFNGDGKLDLIVEGAATGGQYSFPTELFVLLGNGDGTFTVSAPIVPGTKYDSFYPSFLPIGDYNGDGNLDVAVLEASGNNGSVGYFVLLGKGDGTFTLGPPLTVPGGFDFGIATGDFNGDGRSDLAFADNYGNSVHVLLSNGDGTFAPQVLYTVGDQPYSVLAGDFNNDGILDLVTISAGSAQVGYLQGVGDGTFVSKVSFVGGAALTGVAGDALAMGDFNGDGILDVVSTGETRNGTIQVLQGNGDGTFTALPPVVGVAGSSGAYALAVADFNGDGAPDVAGINPGPQNVTILLDTITTHATAMASGISVPGGGQHAVVAAYPGDPLYPASISNAVTLDVPLTATTLSLNSFPSTGPYGRAPTLLVTLAPSGNSAASTDGELVTFLKDGNAIGTGRLTNGAATFSPGTLPVGSNTFTAVYAGDNTFAASTSAATVFTVSAPAASTSTSIAATAGGAYITSAGLGTAVTYTATVKAANGAPVRPGQVRFCDTRSSACAGAALLGTAALQANGTASIVLRPGLGAHPIRAIFAGTSVAAPSTSTVSTVLISGSRSTLTSLLASGSAGNYTLSATVTASGSATGPGGSVAFLDNTNAGAVIGTGALGNPTISRSFAGVLSGTTGAGPSSLVVADFNADGLPDTATVNADGSVSVLLSAGDGTATVKTTAAAGGTGPFALVTGDFNGDGVADLATLGQGAGASIRVLLGKGDGTFGAGTPVPLAGARALVAGDFNGDGVTDLAVATTANTVVTLLGNGDGTFTKLGKTASTGNQPAALAAADLNADGTLDLAVANQDDNSVSVLLNNGDGSFQAQVAAIPTGAQPSRLLLTDVNADGAADLLVLNSADGTLSVLLGANNGTFAPKSTVAVGTSPSDLVAFDFSGDGILDLVVAAGASPGSISLLVGKGDGTFTPSTISAGIASAGASALALGDFNGDGLLDFAASGGSGTGNVTLALQQIGTAETASITGVGVPGAGNHTVVATYPGDAVYGASTAPAVLLTGSQVTTTLALALSTPYNSFGQTLTLTATLAPFAVGIGDTKGESVTFLSNGVPIGTGTLSNGVATLNVATLPVGRSSLTATYGGDSYFLGATAAPVPYRVSPAVAPTTTALSLLVQGAPVTKASPGTVVTLMASVTGLGHGIAPGTVNFCDATAKLCIGNALIGTAQLTGSGVATVQHVFGVGGYQVVAKFGGDTSYGISSSAVATLSVPGGSTSTIAVSGMPGNYTFTGTVATQGSLAAPTGTISFLDTTNVNNVFATAPLGGAAIQQSFSAPGTIPNLPTPFVFAQGDFNHDGELDIFDSTNPNFQGMNSVFALLKGNGDGTFQSTPISNPGGIYTSLTTGDFNGDGNLDVVASGSSSTGGSAVLLLLGKGDGTFTAADVSSALVAGGTGVFSVQSSDFNGDGNLDLLIIDQATGLSGDRYSILLGNGAGGFTSGGAPFFVKAPNFVQALNPTIGDFNRDGIPDLAYIGNNTVNFYAGNGDGTFVPVVTSVVGATNTTGTATVTADFNGDGILDLVNPDYLQGTLTTLLGKGDGTFSSLATPVRTGNEPEYLQTADFNGDGIADVAVTNFSDGTISVLIGKGDGSFNKQVVLVSVAKPTALLTGDFNNDGLPDLFAYSTYGTDAKVYLDTAAYTATATATRVNVPGTGIHFVDASFGGSSAYGVSVSGTIPVTATPAIVTAPTTATTIAISANPTASASGQSVTLTATVAPASGNVSGANGEPVTFLNNNLVLGSGVLLNGTASFSTAALPVGKNSLSVVYNGDSSFSASVSGPLVFAVVPAQSSVALSITAGGQAVTTVPLYTSVALVATVTGGAKAITPGLVQFCDTGYKGCFGQGLIGSAQLNAQGVATLGYRFGAGTHAINAVFLAQKNYSAGTSQTAALNVTGGTSATTLAAAGTQGNYTLTATTVGSGPQFGVTGPLSFYDITGGAKTLLGSATVGTSTQARSFVPGPLLTLPTDLPSGIAVADLNNDGIPDLVTATTLNSGLAVQTLLGAGGTTYGKPVTTVITGIPSAILGGYAPIAIADFNGDGIPDVAVIGGIPASVSVLLGNGDGSFRNSANLVPPSLTIVGGTISIADFNGDGIPDIAVANDVLDIYLGNGDGTFTPDYVLRFMTTTVIASAAGDFNADGHADLALIDGNNSLFVYLGNGDGSFQQHTYTLKNNAGNPTGNVFVNALTIGDFNGDGIIDLASTAGTGGSIDILLGNGDGTFTEQPALSATGFAGITIAAGDLNGDGFDDLATTNGSVTLTYLFSNGDGTFTPQPPIAITLNNRGVAIADANGDGQPDIVLAGSASESLQVLYNTVTETAIGYLPNVSLTGAGVHTVNAVYAGDPLFAGSTSPSILLNGFVALTSSLGLQASTPSTAYGSSVTLTATLNPNGSPGTNGDTVTFVSSSAGTVKTLGTAMLSSGTATLATTGLPAGTDSVTAIFSGDKTYGTATSNAVTVTVTQASSSVAYAPPGTQVYGVTASAAGILNASGTPAGGTVAYTATSGSGATIALGSMSVLPVGTYSLTATYTPADAVDYASSSKTVAGYVVTQAIPAITWATPPAIVYGTQLTAMQLNATTPVAGTFVYSPSAGAILGAGSQKLSVTFSPTDTLDYTTAAATVTLQVNQATPVITWPTPVPVTFGTPLSSTQLNATSPVAGVFTYNPPAGAVPTAGPNTLMATFTPADAVDYTTAKATVVLQVGAVPATVTWAAPAPVPYGTALSATQLNATANTPGSFVYSPAAGAVLAAGTQTLGVTFTPSNTAAYTPATGSTMLVITKVASNVTASASMSPINPGATETISILIPAVNAAAASPTGSVTIMEGSNTLGTATLAAGAATFGTATLSPGVHALSVVYAGDGNYLGSSAVVTAVVNAATPAITWATPASISFGTPLSSTQLNATSPVAGVFTYNPPAGTVLNAGPNVLTVTFTPTDKTSYTTATASVTIQVGAVPATVTFAAPAAISYGTALGAAQLNATANTAGSFVYTPAAGAVLPAGMQTLAVTFTPANTTTYTAATGSAVLLITQAASSLGALASASPINPGAPETITVTLPAINAAALKPTGTVTLTDGGATVGTITLAAGGGSVTIATLAAGTHSLVATYAGDGNYLGSTATVAVVVNAVAPDFTFATTGAATQTVFPGAAASFTFALAPTLTAYPGMVQFAATGLPVGATASFSPGTVAAGGGPQPITLTVNTAAHAANVPARLLPWRSVSFALLFLPLLAIKKRRLAERLGAGVKLALFLLVAGTGLVGMAGCGSQTGFFNQSPQTDTILVTATSGTTQHTTTVTLNVQ